MPSEILLAEPQKSGLNEDKKKYMFLSIDFNPKRKKSSQDGNLRMEMKKEKLQRRKIISEQEVVNRDEEKEEQARKFHLRRELCEWR